MNRWKEYASWALVFSVFLLVGGMILFVSHERTRVISTEIGRVMEAKFVSDSEIPDIRLIMETPTVEITVGDQLISGVKTLKDFPCPVQGSLLRNVGNYYSEELDRNLFHAGQDYAEPEGTVIRATHGGKVVFSGTDPILGQKVTLDCGDGWLVTYGGLENLRVQVGEIVEIQDAIGQVGLFTSGVSENDQPHLHYEVWQGDEVVIIHRMP